MCFKYLLDWLRVSQIESEQPRFIGWECPWDMIEQLFLIFWVFFSWISVPQAHKYSIRAVLNFFENSQRYSRINVYHRCQRHQRKVVKQCQRHRRKINPCHGFSVWGAFQWQYRRPWPTSAAGDSLAESTELCRQFIAGGKIYRRWRWPRRTIYRRCRWHRWTIFAGVVDTADKYSFAIISANFRKIRNDPNGILRGPGDTDLWKKPEVENLVSDSL